MDRSATAALLGLIAIAACTATKEAPPGLGKGVASGPVRAFSASPDGAWLAVLDGCRDAKSSVLPPQTANCTLRVVAAAGGAAKRVADAVTTLPHGLAWSRDGALAALASYDYASATGTLVLWRGGEPRTLASGVSFHGFGPRGELGFVAGGRLSVLAPGEAEPRDVKGADRVASFELSPSTSPCAGDAVRLAAREARAAGGRLLVAGCELREARPLEAGQVADYGFARATPQLAYTVQQQGGAELKLVRTEPAVATRVLGKGARTFAFSPSGKSVAFLCDAAPGKQGDLHVAAEGEKPAVLARDVGELAWARDADRLAWLERYDPRVRSGTLGVGGTGAAARALAGNVSDFELSPDGRRVAFLQHTTRGGYSVDLGLAQLDGADAKPASVAQGAFGFAFSPDGRWLYYRTRCVRNAEACDLERVPAEGLAPGGKPESVAAGVKSFEFDPRDPDRLLVTWQRMDAQALDVAVWQGGKTTSIDTYVSPGTARFLGPDSRRVAYVVQQRKREGLYVAELPQR
ncbi:MAG TPA: LpqB family beta-propeller domain-containing protein [Anaeromyxobacter sp.]|nr:LpqB family beta-propeller domain-containing protein [Anaeromyxobacter sp.]